MENQDIKDKLFELWAWKKSIGESIDYFHSYKIALKGKYSEKTIREIKALMRKDGVPIEEINKIIIDPQT